MKCVKPHILTVVNVYDKERTGRHKIKKVSSPPWTSATSKTSHLQAAVINIEYLDEFKEEKQRFI